MKVKIHIVLFVTILTTAVFAVPPTIPNDAIYLIDPNGWQAGDPCSTYQEWDFMTDPTGNTPDVGIFSPGSPTLNVKVPGFRSGSNNFYSFGGDYEIYADIDNYGTPNDVNGTHVIVQTTATYNGDTSVYPDSLRIVDLNDVNIPGGSNAETLRVDKIATTWAYVDYFQDWVEVEEMIFEFFLPNYTGDFRIIAEVLVHVSTMQFQVDTMLAKQKFDITPIPGPRDVDDDNDVDFADYALFSNNWLRSDCVKYDHYGCGGANFNLDESVDINDLLEFTQYWLEGSKDD